MSWHEISLNNDQVSSFEMFTIQNEFRDIFFASKGPKDMALFCSAQPISREKFVVIYFSPACFPSMNRLITQYNGSQCEKPTKDKVAFLGGHADAWDLLD